MKLEREKTYQRRCDKLETKDVEFLNHLLHFEKEFSEASAINDLKKSYEFKKITRARSFYSVKIDGSSGRRVILFKLDDEYILYDAYSNHSDYDKAIKRLRK
jgi:hypothetical protein